jgi:hypothetical protein
MRLYSFAECADRLELTIEEVKRKRQRKHTVDGLSG